MLSSANGDTDTSTWDATVEYKLSLKLPHNEGDAERLVEEVSRVWKLADHEATFKAKYCRTVDFYDTREGRLRASGLLIRLRVQRSKKHTCLDDSGRSLPGEGKWDVSAKWTAASSGKRPDDTSFDRETDWLAGKDEERARFAASKGVKRDEGEAPEDFVAILDVLALPEVLAPKTTNARPLCSAPVEELRWESNESDPEPTITLWRHRGRFVAAELSFEGCPRDVKFAHRLRKALSEHGLLTAQAESKTEAIYRACPQRD